MKRAGQWLAVLVAGMIGLAGCETEPVAEAPLENYNPGDDTAQRMYGSVAEEHAEEISEERKTWEAGGEPGPKGGYNPNWEYY